MSSDRAVAPTPADRLEQLHRVAECARGLCAEPPEYNDNLRGLRIEIAKLDEIETRMGRKGAVGG